MYHKNGRCESSCLRESLEAKYLLKTRKNVFLDTLDVPVDKSEHFMKKYFWVKKSQNLLIFTFQLFSMKKTPFLRDVLKLAWKYFSKSHNSADTPRNISQQLRKVVSCS